VKIYKGGVDIARILNLFPHVFRKGFHNKITAKAFDDGELHIFPQNVYFLLLFLLKKNVYTEYLTQPFHILN
jgi:hypothetical protein